MKSLAKLQALASRGAEIVVALLLGSMFVAFLLQILFRYVLSLPVGWTVEWVAIAWLWGILFGYAFVVKDSDVIKLDLVYAAVPRSVQRVMDVIAGLTCAAIIAWTLPKCWDYIDFMKVERTAYLRWPFNLIFAIYMPFALAVIYRSLRLAWQGLTNAQTQPAMQAESHDYD